MNTGVYVYSLVKAAVKRGELVRSLTCETCGLIRATFAHHDDYLKPLEVRWLCKSCHAKWHSANGPGLNAELTGLPPARNHKLTDGHVSPRTSDKRFDEMRKLVADGWTLRRIGDIYGVSSERVRQIVGSPFKQRRTKAEEYRELVETKKAEIRSLLEDGKALRHIAYEVGIPGRYLAGYGFRSAPKPIKHGTRHAYSYRKCRCDKCREVAYADVKCRQRKMRTEGRCINCGKPSDGKQRCPACRLKYRNKHGLPDVRITASGIKGIVRHTKSKTWRVVVGEGGKQVYYGSFKDLEKAKERLHEITGIVLVDGLIESKGE